MIYKDVVSFEMYNLIKIIQDNDLFDNYILAGGTALSFQLGHRTSTDIDLFTNKEHNVILITDYFNKNFKKVDITIANDVFIQLFINNIKIELVCDDNKIIKKPITEENIIMFHKSEISAMKLKAIQGRTKARDFIDIAYLLKEFPLKIMFEIYKEKYNNISEKMIKRTMLTKCKSINEDEWLVNIKMIKNDILPKDVLKCIEKGIEEYNKDVNIGNN